MMVLINNIITHVLQIVLVNLIEKGYLTLSLKNLF